MAHKLLDITPTPDVLVALTRTPISPLDALSELIDNAIDSFRAAETAGQSSPVRQVLIDIPGNAEVGRDEGLVRVRDTGAGLSEEQIADAMRAGFSNKNHYDTLGLFGMGFNIATGKLGRVTRVVSARRDDDYAVEVVLDLPRLIQDRKFTVTAERRDKPQGLEHGTVVEVRGWWPAGDANSGFIRDLAKIPKNTLRDRIGRRYATLLRGECGEPVHINVNGVRCQPFEHCTWSTQRYVTRQAHGNISARVEFDEVIDQSRRCLQDGTEFGAAEYCLRCGGGESREIRHRIRGWVGIQRFDDQDDFGIDLIRNGRAIRVAEKEAFFQYTDQATGRPEREYPIDQQYGRIVGEVHLDQVPVDFQKQDFQKATTEWQAAMAYLRGGSLLPTKWEEGIPNSSHVSQLFQGYRKVRNIGRGDMYMGHYDVAKGKAARIPRDVEREYYRRFLNREVGYYDDAKWWELVETAGEPPIEALPECPECGFQNPRDAETCSGCEFVLDSKPCRNTDCQKPIQRSAVSCQHCGTSQVTKIEMPWACAFCSTANKAGEERCSVCNSVKGSPHPASSEALEPASEERPGLSVSRLVIALANGKPTDPLDIEVRSVMRPIAAAHGHEPVPLVTNSKPGHMTVYADLTHPAFTDMGLRPEYLIASEAAQYLHALHANLRGQRAHTIATLTSEILKQGWGESVAENADTVRTQIKDLFSQITEKVATVPRAEDFYDELDETQQRSMAESMIKSGVDLSELSRLKKTGGYLRFCDKDTLASFFNRHPGGWFGGQVWSDGWPEAADVGPIVAEKLREELHLKYLRCLEDCASYLRYEQPERLLVVRASAAAEFLSDKLS
ncbi:ATP-binding protein [Kitasatospora sp. NBC_00070]|uniref:ATP-binding protein n=1 Tax=Kitasatospora sp. NBC_00070 TaxID=2975962 RepID=UPI0032437511